MKLWKIALIFIAPLAIAPLAADARDHPHHAAWQQEPVTGPRDHPHHAAWQQEPAAGLREHPHHAAWQQKPAAGPGEYYWVWQQEPIVLSVRLGTEAGELKIVPSKLTLQTETPYKLVIRNPSDVAHVLVLPEFRATVKHSSAPAFPYKPAEIDVAARETVEWYFVPTKAGHYKMGCAVRAHADAGMDGEIVVRQRASI